MMKIFYRSLLAMGILFGSNAYGEYSDRVSIEDSDSYFDGADADVEFNEIESDEDCSSSDEIDKFGESNLRIDPPTNEELYNTDDEEVEPVKKRRRKNTKRRDIAHASKDSQVIDAEESCYADDESEKDPPKKKKKKDKKKKKSKEKDAIAREHAINEAEAEAEQAASVSDEEAGDE